MMEGMAGWERECRKLLPPRAVRLIVDRPASFVFHDVTLGVELLLRHRRQQAAHPVGLQPQRECKLIRRDGLEVVGAVEPRRAIQSTTRSLNQLEMLVRGDVRRTLEEHVLEQVRESSSAHPLVCGAHMVPEVHRNQRSRVVLGQRDE